MCRKSSTIIKEPVEEPKVKVVEKLDAESAFKLAKGLRDRLIAQGVLDELLGKIYESIQESALKGFYFTNYTYKDCHERLFKDDIRDTLESMGYVVHDTEAGMYHWGSLSITWDKRNKGKDEN